MKRIWAMALILLLCAGCAPRDDENAVISAGSEDGGGSGYGVSVQSVMRLSDFYGVTVGSTRENNLLILGSPLYSLGSSDTYTLSDGSQVVLTYDTTGALADTLYTDFESGKSYGLFDYLISIGVLQGTIGDGGEENTPTPDGGAQSGQGESGSHPIFSAKTYRKADFDGKLSLYLDRNTVLSTIGAPAAFAARQYKSDSYIIDHYYLDDGSILMLDYGYDRDSLRCAAIKGADGVTSGYLGTWAAQSKPADFVRPKVELGQISALVKGMAPAKIYAALGEPAWMEGTAAEYRDVFVLSDGSHVYLSYSDAHSKLEGAYQVTTEGKPLEVSLR